ncbi:MAG: class I tRNA ligase family protein [Anaerolineae bacterium]
MGTWGNLAHRILTFAYRNFEGRVPEPGELTDEDRAIIASVEAAYAPVAEDIEACRFRAGLAKAMAVAREANRYLDAAAPWKALKVDRARAATSVYVTLKVVDSLKLLFAPFVPFSSEKLHATLGYDEPLFGTQEIVEYQESQRRHAGLTYHGVGTGDRWVPSDLQAGQALREPAPLFKKLDDEIVEQELARLG